MGGIPLPTIKTYCPATVIKTVWRDGYTPQRNRTGTQTQSHTNVPSDFFYKRTKVIRWQKIALSTKGAGENGESDKKTNLNLNPMLYNNQLKMDHGLKCKV